jgi:hypothetical protein
MVVAFFYSTAVAQQLPAQQENSTDARGELVSVEYDARQDITKITLNPFVLISRKQEELRMGAITAYQGKTKQTPKEVAVLFLSLSATDSNKYESARKLTFIIDDERIMLGETSRSRQIQNNIFADTMMVKISTEVFIRLSRAKTASIKLGLTEVALTEKHFNVLRVAVSYMTE